MYTLKKYTALLIFVIMLCVGIVVPLFAEEVGIKAAPLSPEFLKWQKEQSEKVNQPDSKSPDEDGSEFSYPTGDQPDPIDLSHLSKNPPKENSDSKHPEDGDIKLPEKYDLRDEGRVPPIRNQSPYNTCWTFAATAACESNYLSQKLSFLDGEPDLSELNTAWFVYKDPEPGNSFYMSYPSNHVLDQLGNESKATSYLARSAGAVYESTLPYTTSMTGNEKPEDYHPIVLRLKETRTLGNIDSSNRETMLPLVKEMIIKHGAVKISYNSQDPYYFKNSSGSTAFYYETSSSNHAVTVIGWDDNYSKENFKEGMRPENNGAWLVRNSWNTWWGDKGYFWMSYEQYIRGAVVFIAGENEPGTKYYGYDALGKIGAWGYQWAGNVFRAEDNNEVIKEVGFYTNDNNAQYDLYIFDLGTEQPSQPVPNDMSSPLFSVKNETIAYAGYHTVTLPRFIPIKKDHYFSVILRMVTPNYGYPMAAEYQSENYAYPEVNENESYFSNYMTDALPTSGQWSDGSTHSAPKNACIKAFTVPLIEINADNFPDNIFREYVNTNFDSNNDGWLSDSEIAAVKNISVRESRISSLKGVEYFTALTNLDCSNNQLTTLDVSKNTVLTELNCWGNQFTTLDVSKNTALTCLYCGTNQLTVLDISRNTALTDLYCDGNQLTTLDVSKNTALTRLVCDNSQLTAIDVSKNTALTYLWCDNNQLTTLEVSYNTALTQLKCYNNHLTALDVSKNTALTDLEAGGQTLKTLHISKQSDGTYHVNFNNYVSDLTKVSNVHESNSNTATYDPSTGIASFASKPSSVSYKYDTGYSDTSYRYMEVTLTADPKPEIITLPSLTEASFGVEYSAEFEYTGDDSIAWSITTGSLPQGLSLNTSTGKISGAPTEAGIFTFTVKAVNSYGEYSKEFTLTVTGGGNTGIPINSENFPDDVFRAYVSGSFDEDNNGWLTDLEIAGSKQILVGNKEISSLKGIEYFLALTELDCSNNQLTELDMSENTALTRLYCYNNQLTALNVSKNTSLIELLCDNNQLEKLDLDENTALIRLYCDNNQLTELDVSKNTSLKYLYCCDNKLTVLDVSNNTALMTLDCYRNQLTALDVSKNTALTDLNCYGNQLTTLDVSKNTALTDLNCYSNQLTTLDLSSNAALTNLNCSSNQLTTLEVSKNTALSKLYCSSNQLTTIDVSKNTALTFLQCPSNYLTAIDLSNNNKLSNVYIYGQSSKTLLAFRQSDGTYQVNFSNYVTDLTKVSDVKDSNGNSASYNTSTGIVSFTSKLSSVSYKYDTGYSDTSGRYMTVTLTADTKPAVIISSLPAASHGKTYSTVLEASGEGTITWAVSSGKLPQGLSLKASTGQITGTPSETGTFTFMVKAVSSYGEATKTLSITVKPTAPAITTSATLSAGTDSKAYTAVTLAASGTTPITWSITSGKLPSGMSMTSAGKISGTPSGTGTFKFTVKASNAGGSATREFTLKINALAPTITTAADLGTVYLNKAYSLTLAASGTKTITWTKTGGTLPNGITLANTGKLSGTPTKTGTFSFTLKAANSGGSASRTFKLIVTQPAISGTLTASGAVKNSYSSSLTVSGGISAYKWSVSSGKLPDGLKLTYSGTKATVSGTPTKAGKFTFTLKVTDKNNVAATKACTVTITQPAISGTLTASGIVKKSYSSSLTVSGGISAYKWSVSSGKLPDGLKLTYSGTKATVSGTPTKAGKFTFTLKVTDKNNVAATKACTVTITQPTISGSLAASGIVKKSYSSSLTVSGGTSAYKWSVSKGSIPSGLKLSYSGTKATVSGKPTKAGTFTFTLKVTDKNGAAATKAFTVKVTAPSISGTLSAGTVKKSYSATLKASGGTSPYTWTKSAGTLPNGLTLNKSSGKLSGTPTKAGTFSFTVKVTDKNGATATKAYKVTIKAASTKKALPGEYEDEYETDYVEEETSALEFEFDSNAAIHTASAVPEPANYDHEVQDSGHVSEYADLSIDEADVIKSNEGRDYDLVIVRADQPLTFTIGNWTALNVNASAIRVFVNDECIEGVKVSDEGSFTLPAEIVCDDFRVRAESEASGFETEELYISAQ